MFFIATTIFLYPFLRPLVATQQSMTMASHAYWNREFLMKN